MREFELFILRKYNRGEMTAIDYSKINILLGEFEQEEWVLNFCPKCNQMTNHIKNGRCLKCKKPNDAYINLKTTTMSKRYLNENRF